MKHMGINEEDGETLGKLDSKEVGKKFNEFYPMFEQTTGWSAKGDYDKIPPDLRKSLLSYFNAGPNQAFFELIGRVLPNWDKQF